MYLIEYFKLNFVCFFFREKLGDVHDEYEEREKRWNRIASLLDREDIINTSTIPSGI